MDWFLLRLAGFDAASGQADSPVAQASLTDDLAMQSYVPQVPELERPLVLPGGQAEAREADVESADEVASEAAADPLVDTQQWLAMMLNQQVVQLQALDYSNPGPNTTTAFVPNTADPILINEHDVRGDEPLPALLGAPTHAMSESARTAATASSSSSAVASEGLLTQSLVSTPSETSTPTVTPSALPAITNTAGPVLERGLTLAAPQARWGEQMLHALRETVEVQVQQRFNHATIRLDPPELGSLEIFISHESGRLSVHISAADIDVARLIAQTSDRLRKELVQQNTLLVQVQISNHDQGSSSRQQGHQPRESTISQAIEEAHVSDGAGPGRTSDVLVTV